MSANRVNKAARQLLIFAAILFVLSLTTVNIEKFLAPKKVLGVETKIDPTEVFWQEFLNTNPNYIPGWIELGRMERVKEIDPNYKLDTSD